MIGGAVLAAAVAGALSLVPGTNGSFDAFNELPKEWSVQEYVAGASTVKVTRGDAFNGPQFLQLKASKPNHTRVFLPVDVDAQSTYKLTAEIRVPSGSNVPAVLMLDGSTATTASIEGDNKWHKTELYINTGDNTQVTPVLSLGRFGELAQGTADFDDVSIEKVDAAPAGAIAADAVATSPAAGAAATTPATPVDPNGPSRWLVPLALLIIAIVVACGVALKRGDANDPALHPELKPKDDDAADEPKNAAGDAKAEQADEPKADAKADKADADESASGDDATPADGDAR